jgi:hypothetical protein
VLQAVRVGDLAIRINTDWQTVLGYPHSEVCRAEERAMNITAAVDVITELSDDYQPAEVLGSWAERVSDAD